MGIFFRGDRGLFYFFSCRGFICRGVFDLCVSIDIRVLLLSRFLGRFLVMGFLFFSFGLILSRGWEVGSLG